MLHPGVETGNGDEICKTCDGIGVVGKSPEEEGESERRRQQEQYSALGSSGTPPAGQIDWAAIRTLLPKVAAANKSAPALRLPLTTLTVERDRSFGSTFVVWRYFNDINGEKALRLLNFHLAEIGLEAEIFAHSGDGDDPAAMRCLFKVRHRSH
jgi:hypothetical protein